MKIISIANQKGGVAKTTTSINLAYGLARKGKRVLLLDFDPQASASSGLNHRKVSKSIYDVFFGADFSQILKKTSCENLFLMPSNQNLAAFEYEIMQRPDKERTLSQKLNEFKDSFDVVVIDCAPSLGLLTINALVASDFIVIPVQSEFYALEGLSLLLETADKVQKRWNPNLQILGLLLTMFDKRNLLHKEVGDDIKKHFKDRVFKTYIARNIRLAEAASFGKSIQEYDKNSIGAIAYENLADEVYERIWKKLD